MQRMSPDDREPGAAAVFDWNRAERAPAERRLPPGGVPAEAWAAACAEAEAWLPFGRGARPVEVLDETLRDGIQGVSTVNPPSAHKIELLHAMASIGVDA